MTPKGRAQYPHLNQPDDFKGDVKYKCSLIVPADDAEKLIEEAKDFAEECFGKKSLSKVVYPWDTNDSGDLVIKTKSTYAPKFYDTKGHPVPESQVPQLWGGSVLKLKGSMASYDAGGNKGITLYMSAVQIIEPVSGGESGGHFDEEEGFEIDANAFEPEAPTADGEPLY